MRRNVIIALIGLIIIIAAASSYYALIPQYKNVTMSGFSFEVPDSSADVVKNSDNYNTYEDSEHNLTIRTLAINNINDVNNSVKAGDEIKSKFNENMGDNCTYENLSLTNKSGLYSYYDLDVNHSCVILITSSDAGVIKHIVDTLKKPDLNQSIDPLNMTLNNTEDNQTSKQVTTSKKSTSKKSSSDDGYRYSPQSGDYIKEYTDSNGIQHIDHKNGARESYNPKTGVLTSKSASGRVYEDYMG